ncbi:N-acetyltransferase GCN5 [uncultured delta proteobacterium]|uniref:N-acetyltransferase GCN5 n=1 Tax=uncultured delta proteobacterium TaxID=34034 RepID=A0A212K2K9_9DELT|nr:N-acetyltransferase GCN5 [uncultured delta proteobacterium]
MAPATVLETARLILRPWRDEDYEPFYTMSVDPRVCEYLPPFPDRAASDAFVDGRRKELDARGWGFWALEEKDSSRFVGTAGIHEPGPEFGVGRQCVEIGWRLAPPFWGRGYATEAAREILRFGFCTLKLPEIVSFTALGNARSYAVMERLGMRREPEPFDLLLLPEGHPHRPHWLYVMTRETWLEKNS